MRHFGLIGYPLSHSFSPAYFNEKFSKAGIKAEYSAYPLQDISEFDNLIRSKSFSGLNVTIPYKQKIIPLLDDLDPTALETGAVNVIKFNNNRSIGYNTDVFGFEKSLTEFLAGANITKALVLGTGGSSMAVTAALEKLNIVYDRVSRDKTRGITYGELTPTLIQNYNLVINTTPLGMAPDTGRKPDIPYDALDKNYFLFDLIYNPENTLFLTEGLRRGTKVKNGFDMLIYQAEKAWEIWNEPII